MQEKYTALEEKMRKLSEQINLQTR